MKTFIYAMLAVLFGSMAQATVVDFESVQGLEGTTSISADGFEWDFVAGGWAIGDLTQGFYPDGVLNGTNILMASGDRNGETANVVMTKTGGGTFDIASLWAASSNTGLANSVTIVGDLFGGGLVSTTIAVGGMFSEYLLSGFTNLVSVTFTSVNSGAYNTAGFALDDISLTSTPAVPLPGSLPLLVVAAGGLAMMRRPKGA